MSTVSSATAAASAAATNTASISETAMGKEDFLTLLVAQLQNQDPLNPSDPTEFTAQLAQFSSLEQLFTVNKNLTEMVATGNRNSSIYALEMIGQNAVLAGNKFEFKGGTTELGFELKQAADEATLYVMDRNGVTVKTFEDTALEAGHHFVEWDGTNDAGAVVDSGEYRLVASADYGGKQQEAAQALVVSEVKGVDFDDDNPQIVTDLGDFAVGDVKSIRKM
jgi:flagellar basal-body rod modification protein FlgD